MGRSGTGSGDARLLVVNTNAIENQKDESKDGITGKGDVGGGVGGYDDRLRARTA